MHPPAKKTNDYVCDANGVGSDAKPSTVPFASDFTELVEVSGGMRVFD
jgi:hypothetical protein